MKEPAHAASRGFLFFLHIFFLSRNGGALPAAMEAAAKRASRLQERSSCFRTSSRPEAARD
jgi:hypothetical protein